MNRKILTFVTFSFFLSLSMSHSQPRLCNRIETNTLVQHWNTLKNKPNKHWRQPLTFENRHPQVQNPQFFFAPPVWRSSSKESVGLPIVVFNGAPGEHFSRITKHSFLCNLQPATIVLEKHPDSYNAVLYDPRETFHHLDRPLATKEGLIIDYFRLHPQTLGLNISSFFSPKKHLPKRGLYLSSSYNPSKIPLLMIHGVASSPAAFRELTYAIESNEHLAKTYQLWYYYYPSGSPWIISAKDFRDDIRTFLATVDPKKQSPHHNNICLISHSMGGLISRLSCSNPGNHLKDALLENSSKKLILSKEEEKSLSTIHSYKPLGCISRILFAAVPHRGSELASGALTWATENTVNTGSQSDKPNETVLSDTVNKALGIKDVSVSQLQPSHPGILALNQMPLAPNIITHSLRGTLPLLSTDTDGVVTYASSYFEGAQSEHSTTTGHTLINHPDAIEEVLRILQLHAQH